MKSFVAYRHGCNHNLIIELIYLSGKPQKLIFKLFDLSIAISYKSLPVIKLLTRGLIALIKPVRYAYYFIKKCLLKALYILDLLLEPGLLIHKLIKLIGKSLQFITNTLFTKEHLPLLIGCYNWYILAK